jgi:hypothetical protein
MDGHLTLRLPADSLPSAPRICSGRYGHAHHKEWEDDCCGDSGAHRQGCLPRPAEEIEILKYSDQVDKNGDNECDYEKGDQ